MNPIVDSRNKNRMSVRQVRGRVEKCPICSALEFGVVCATSVCI